MLLLALVFLLTLYFLYTHVSRQLLFAAGQRPAVQYCQLHYRWSRVSLLDVDLTCPGVRVEIAAAGAARRYSGCTAGAARTVADWCRSTGAVGGINGGFFGRELGSGRKEIVGLLKLDGELFARAPRYRTKGCRVSGVGCRASDPTPDTQRPTPYYAHSALGFDPEGRPAIDWVVSDPRRPRRLLAFEQPEGLQAEAGLRWEIESGLSGGPRLIARGRIAVSDRQEHLNSNGLLPRTFVAYDRRDGVPCHLVLGVATSMSFQDAARFLNHYFRRFHGLPCAEAMCLDGGPSSQLVYRADGVIDEAQSSDVTVPTCVLVQTDEGPMEEAQRSTLSTMP